MEWKLTSISLLVHFVVIISAVENATEFALGQNQNEGTKDVKSRNLPVEDNSIEAKSNRNPKFGFAFPFPNIPGSGGDINSTPGPGGPPENNFGGLPDIAGTTATLGTTAVLIKGGILSGITALKAAIFPPIFLAVLVIFLMAGAAFFTCSIVNCGRLFGDIGGPGFNSPFGGPSSSHFSSFNRNGIDEYEQQRPVYQAIDEGYKKFD